MSLGGENIIFDNIKNAIFRRRQTFNKALHKEINITLQVNC